MNITVKLFAAARAQLDSDEVEIELPTGATVGDLRAALAAARPNLAALLASSLIAVDHDYAGEKQEIPAGAEIALIPPVSGG